MVTLTEVKAEAVEGSAAEEGSSWELYINKPSWKLEITIKSACLDTLIACTKSSMFGTLFYGERIIRK